MKQNRLFWLSISMIMIGTAGMWVISAGRHGYGYHHLMMGGPQMGHSGMSGGTGYPKGISPKNLPDGASEGAKLFVSYCIQCHVLPDPGSHISTDWPAIVNRMEGNIRALGRKQFNEVEKKSIVDYLMTHSEHS